MRYVVAAGLALFFLVACSSDTASKPETQSAASTTSAVTAPSPVISASTPTRVPIPTAAPSTAGSTVSKDAVSESTYDIDCMVPILGRKLTDNIIHGGRSPTSDELAEIDNCKLRFEVGKGDQDKNGVKGAQGDTGRQETKVGQGVRGAVNDTTYDINCMVSVLGRSVTDDIAYGGRVAIAGELAKTQHCKLGSDDGKRSQDDQGSDDRQDGCDDQGNCDDDEKGSYDSSGYTYACFGHDVDSSGMPTGPQCNLIPPPLPAGVTEGTLLSVSLPAAGYQVPVGGCQVLENEKCAELRWARTSDLQAGEFVAIEISRTDPNVMYAGVDSNDMSMYRSLDAGASWDLVHIAGHVGGVAISPINPDNVIYTNLETAVYQTLDGGKTWGDVVGGRPGGGKVRPWTAIAFSKDNPEIVYTTALSGSSRGGIWPAEPADVFRSTDEGKTWEQVGTCELCSSVQTIVVTEGDPNFVWVAADGGLLYSKDGGRTWSSNVLSYLDERAMELKNLRESKPPKVVGLAAQPGNPGTMLAASSMYGMFRSTDGGTSWVRSNEGLTSSKLHRVNFSISNPNVVYVATHDGVFRSDDAGKSWTERNFGLLNKFVSPIAIHPTNEDIVFVGTTSEIYTIHPEHQRRGLYGGGGLYKTLDGGKTWVRSDRGIVEAKIAQIGTHPLFPFNLWVGGESGRGNLYSPDGGNSWLFSGSMTAHYPMVYAFSYDIPTVMWATGWQVSGELAGSTNGGANWFTRTEKLNEGLSAKTRELGLRLEGANDFHIHGVAVAPSDSNIIYVGSVHDSVYADLQFNLNGVHIFKSSDGGLTFPEMSNGFPIETETSINSIVVHPRNPDIAYAMTSLHETTTAIGIYKTTDGAQLWVAVNDGLDLYTNDLQMDPIKPEVLYAATESGVFKTINGATTWKKSSNGIPKGAVIDMAMDPLNPMVLYAITPENIYRTQDGADNWYAVTLGIPLLEDTSKTLSAQDRLLNQLALDRTKTGHSMYGGTFAQDRTLEIDATGRVIVVAVKTNRSDKDKRNERILYRAVLTPLVEVSYEFSVDDPQRNIVDARVKVRSQSNIYDMFFNSNNQELKFVVAGPSNTNSKTTVVIPSSLLSGGDHALACCTRVFVDGKQVSSSSTNEGVMFEHAHVGRSEVVIKTK
jgi:photosystem II stability/assembly factor-like uncharacterized protein